MIAERSSAALPPDLVSALSHDSASPVGVLLLHGITGSPAAWRPIASDLIADGTAVRVPVLPGHGTQWRDLNSATWHDWRATAAEALADLSARHRGVVVAGLSMGGALALDLAASGSGPDGLVLVNPALRVDSPLSRLLPAIKHMVPSVRAIGNDIALPDQDEHAYPRTPLRAVVSMQRAQYVLRNRLWRITTPTVLCVSGSDHVVGPWSSALLRSRLAGPVRCVALRRSYHVATLDYDAPVILQEIRRLRDTVAARADEVAR